MLKVTNKQHLTTFSNEKKQSKKIRTNLAKRRARKKQKRRAKLKSRKSPEPRGSEVACKILKTISHYFPKLFDRIREIEDYRKRPNYELAELIMAGISMFIFKQGSRNAMNNARQEAKFAKNYKRMFKLRLPHLDTVDRLMCVLEEKELEALKRSMIKALLEKKALHKYKFMGKFTIAIDGTGVHSFSEKPDDKALHKTSKKGKVTYFYQVLEAKILCPNGLSISIATEWIENEGEYDKQDCEQKAFVRLAQRLKQDYPRLPIILLADGLYPNKTFFDICKANHWEFILTFKDGNLPSIWQEIALLPDTARGERELSSYSKKHLNSSAYQWINALDYKGHSLNWIECVQTKTNRKTNEETTTRFVHLCSFCIDFDSAPLISANGRLRWKIENEGFNAQKNHGYELEHKYSQKSYRASKNYYQCLQIAHIINQLTQLSQGFAQLLKSKTTLKHLWKCLIAFLIYGKVNSHKLQQLLKTRSQIRLI